MLWKNSALSPHDSRRMTDDLEDADETDDTDLNESRRSWAPSSMASVSPENVSLERRPLSLASTLRPSCITASPATLVGVFLHFLPQHLVQLTVKFQVSLPPLLLGQPNLKSNFRSGPAPPDPYVLTPNEVVVVLDSVAFVYLANRNRQEQIPSIQVFLEFLAVCHLRLWLATACLYCGRSSLVSYLLGS